MTELEKKICDVLHVKYGVFTGNGTTAMYLVFLALRRQNKKVIFPAISCTNPVNSALFAGYNVDFCDVNLEDYTIDLYELERMLKTGQYGIVVPTHIYGHRYDEAGVRKLCEKYHVMLFEDAAQTFYVGDMDVSVMSFGHTKVCETSSGGGIALTNSQKLYEDILRAKRNLPEINDMESRFDEYRDRYYEVVGKYKSWEQRNIQLRKLQLDSKEYFIFDLQNNDEIEKKLADLDDVVARREEKVNLYQAMLDDRHTRKPIATDNYRWRYTFLYQGDRQYLLDQARKRGIDISSWYYSLAGIYKNQHLKNADQVEQKVVNLWVDESHTCERIRTEICILNEIMEADHARYQ